MPFAAGQHQRHLVQILAEPHLFQLREGPFITLGLRHFGSTHFKAEGDIGQRIAPRQQPRLLEHIGQPIPRSSGIRPIDGYAAFLDRQQFPQQAQRRRFSTSGGSQQADELAGGHVERKVFVDRRASQLEADPRKTDDGLHSISLLNGQFNLAQCPNFVNIGGFGYPESSINRPIRRSSQYLPQPSTKPT